MKVVVIEDEMPAANRLIKLLRNMDDTIDVVNRFDSVEPSVKFFQGIPKVDLVFMDIQLADGLSFDIFIKPDGKETLFVIRFFLCLFLFQTYFLIGDR